MAIKMHVKHPNRKGGGRKKMAVNYNGSQLNVA